MQPLRTGGQLTHRNLMDKAGAGPDDHTPTQQRKFPWSISARANRIRSSCPILCLHDGQMSGCSRSPQTSARSDTPLLSIDARMTRASRGTISIDDRRLGAVVQCFWGADRVDLSTLEIAVYRMDVHHAPSRALPGFLRVVSNRPPLTGPERRSGRRTDRKTSSTVNRIDDRCILHRFSRRSFHRFAAQHSAGKGIKLVRVGRASRKTLHALSVA